MTSLRRAPNPRRSRQPQGPTDGGAGGDDGCWQALQTVASGHDHTAWASVASQRPATERRLGRLVGAIERDVIPRLVRAHADASAGARRLQPGATEVDAFAHAIIARDDARIDALLTLLRERGVGVASLFTDLLAPAAAHLGHLWEEDRCHFADVTIGIGRLQQIMRGLSSAFGTEVDPPPGGRRALLMPAAGEQHTFGLSMVAEFFARSGWDVAGLLDPRAGPFEDRVAREWFDLVGISAGSTTRLDGVRACVDAVRRCSHNRAVAVMVGGPLFVLHPDMASKVEADAVVTDGQQAPRLAEQLLAQRAGHRHPAR